MVWKKQNWWMFCGLVLLDQVSKAWASRQNTVVFNPGISFGIFAELPSFILTGVILGLAVAAGWWWYKNWSDFHLATTLFWSGAVSNLFDRVIWGAVRDWLPLPLPLQLASKNNLADWFITFGVVLLVYQLVRTSEQNKVQSTQDESRI